jgi:putative cell wall-binding protein
VGTAIAVSQAAFPDAGSAGAVVLARADNYPDALVGTPLAGAKNAPLLFASGAALTSDTVAEIRRVLPAGGTVYLLGGPAALPTSVATQVTALGYEPVRYAGTDRYGTALAVADALHDPSTVLLATGTNFPDALSAGTAAAHLGGVVLLTAGTTMPSAVAAYLSAHPGQVYAVGGSAVTADPKATPLAGADRYVTATIVASTLFSSPTEIGIASGETFADALTGGAYEAHVGGVLLLSTPATLSAATAGYLRGISTGVATSHIFAGTGALSAQVQVAVGTALGF